MNKTKTKFSLSSAFTIAAFIVVAMFLIGLTLIENGVINNDKIRSDYTILDYELLYVEDSTSATGVTNVYIIEPGITRYDDTVIAFYTVHQYSKVFVDGKLVCSIVPSEDFKVTKTIGSNWVLFNLSKADAYKEIRIEVVSAYANVEEKEIEFIKGTTFAIFFKVLRENLPPIVFGFSAILIGVIFIIASIYRKILNKECYTIFMWGLFAIFLGSWRMFDSSFMPLVMPKKTVFVYYVVVTSLTISPIPFMFALKTESDVLWRQVYDLICIIIAIVAISQIGLQVVYGVDVRKYLYIYHDFLLVCLVVVLISEIYHKVKGFKRTNRIHEYLPIICIVAVLLDLVIYYYTRSTIYTYFTILVFLFYICISGLITLREYGVREQELKNELHQSQITILLSQIQPHFIYNTLSSIRYLCKVNPVLAQKSIDDFSLYLRCNMDSLQKNDLVPFEKELTFIETYANLEQLRFGKKIRMYYDIKESNFNIPSLTIQPLIENAIKHGISVKEEGGTVILRTEKVDKGIKISIIDDGVGFSVDKDLNDNKTHIGLLNVKNRLIFLADADFNIESNENGTKIEILIRKFDKEKRK